MIGNDIVDLSHIKTRWKGRRFLDKVFSKKEQKLISASENPNQTVWLLWSMKEAAYKADVQRFEKRYFNPKKLVCHFSSSTDGYVSIGKRTYYTTSIISKNYIYSVASLNFLKCYESAIIKLENDLYLTQSVSLKNHFMKSISKSKGLYFNHLSIRKNAIGVPEIFHNNLKFPIQISLTHCGNYGGYVYC
jgi:phosphopantetheinyl transferase (holo-ACP synthase)